MIDDKGKREFIRNAFDIPYKPFGRDANGMDCWGLVILCYKELLGIDIPAYQDIVLSSMSNYKQTASQIQQQIQSYFPFKEVDKAQFGDFILINILGEPLHIGFALDGNTMLHTTHRTGVVSESYRGLKWQRRIKAYYRWEAAMER